LGIEDSHNVEHENGKEKLKECVRILRLIMNTELSKKYKMQANGTVAIPVLRYSFGIIR
jgi:hypothetical protein